VNHIRCGLAANSFYPSATGVRKALTLLLFGVALLICPAGAIAQVSTAQLTGTVTDPSGAAVPNAQIKATQTETKLVGRAVTDQQGVFTIPALPVGPYALDVSAQGFGPYNQTGIVLTVGQVANLQIQLHVGNVVESVTVTGAAPAIEATESSIRNTIEETAVVDLPLNGRNPASLVNTTAGVENPAQNVGTGQLSTINQIVPAGTNPGSIATATNGVRSGGMYFSLDGASNVDPSAVIGGPFPDPDATQEFEVVTSGYGARYISAPGGAVNIITRSGTNNIHGTLFEFLRNGYVNAENPILAQPDTLKRNQYGATIGAPIVKDRWFIFGSYQGTRIASQTVNLYPVPLGTATSTEDERHGFFESCPPGGSCTLVNLNALPPVPMPNTESPVNANFYNFMGSGQPLIPYANSFTTGNNFVIGVPIHSDEEQFVIKSDLNLGKHRLSARYFYDHLNSPPVGEPTSAPFDVFDTAGGSRQYWDSAVVGDTWVTGNWILNTRLSYLRIRSEAYSPASNQFVNYPALGAVDYSEPTPPGIGITVVGNMIPPAITGTTSIPRESLDGSEDVIHVMGKHEISFGGDIRHVRYGQSNAAGQTGVIIYEGVYAGILDQIFHLNLVDGPFVDFYLGHPIQFIQSDGFFDSAAGFMYGFYGQDKYRVTSRLTLTAGLRWDPFTPFTPDHNQIDCWRPGEQSTVFPNAPAGLIYPGDPHCNGGGTTAKYGEFQPRVGMGYQLDKKGNDAIRAGYGIYVIQVPLSNFQGFSAFPWVRTFTITNPFQNIADIWGSNGTTDPFAGGFQGSGFIPPKNVTYPTFPSFPVGPSVGAISPNFRPGYVQQWSVSFQHAISKNDSLELAYIGTKGSDLAQSFDANLPVAGAGASTSNEQERRPFNALGQIREMSSIGYSNYNGFQATYRHRISAGLGIVSDFTWSKCIDDGSNPGGTGGVTEDQNDPNALRGLCDFDQKLNWRSTITWNSPSLSDSNGVVRAVFGSWTASGLLTLDSGQPFSVTTGTSDNSFTGTGLDLADRVPGEPLYVDGRLNYLAFTLNAPGTLGDSGRNSFRSVGNYDFDMALIKNFKLTERWNLMFRAEAFNLLNHANYFGPNSAWASANPTDFDTYQFARDPRQLQFALKLMF